MGRHCERRSREAISYLARRLMLQHLVPSVPDCQPPPRTHPFARKHFLLIFHYSLREWKRAGLTRDGDLDLRTLFQRFLDTVGPGRIIFGTDSSWFPRGFARRYLELQYQTCSELGLREGDLRRIFAGNAARLLGLSLPTPHGHAR